LAATTSSTGLLAKELSPIAVPRAAAARATATSPSGCTACTPVGEMMTGSAIGWPRTVVARSRCADNPATCGAKPNSPNAAMLSSSVSPRSEPAMSAPYTDFGSRRLARRWASATVSNQALLICSFPSSQAWWPARSRLAVRATVARLIRNGRQETTGRNGVMVRARTQPAHTPAP
jgi:hypothetical protein